MAQKRVIEPIKMHFTAAAKKSSKSSVSLQKWRREWFYYIDHKGMLFLEETEPKNYTSCLKDERFLDFFFDALRENDTGQFEEYKYVSPCWGEANFIKVFAAPIVFRHMDIDGKMHYAGSKTEEFDPEKLFIDDQGLLNHEIVSHENIKVGSFDTNLACELSENLSEKNDPQTGKLAHFFEWEGREYKLEERSM